MSQFKTCIFDVSTNTTIWKAGVYVSQISSGVNSQLSFARRVAVLSFLLAMPIPMMAKHVSYITVRQCVFFSSI